MIVKTSDIDPDDEESLEILDERLTAHIRSAPPSCLRELEPNPVEPIDPEDHRLTVAYRIQCRCSGKRGHVLGYPLRDYNPKHQGNLLISPLAFECSNCGKATEFFDTDQHGYHAEVGKLEGDVGSTKLRGTGERSRLCCPHCAEEVFTLKVGFVFWDFYFFHEELEMIASGDGQDVVFEHPQDFYNEILIQATCDHCQQTTSVTDFGKL